VNTCAGDPAAIQKKMARQSGQHGLPPYLSELARLEFVLFQARTTADQIPDRIDEIIINPTLSVWSSPWRHLCGLISGAGPVAPEPGEEMLLVWVEPRTGTPRARPATDNDLLILKMVAEDIPLETVAAQGDITPGQVWARMQMTARKGLILTPPSAIRRDPEVFPPISGLNPEVYVSSVFTLQWHVTQACDLNCRHCYDRADLPPLPYDRALTILEDFTRFCRAKQVSGHISFSGGNPLLYPHFTDLYRAASINGFSLGILGNPAGRDRLEELMAIEKPAFYQVSLEGLPDHNDYIRGPGHFERTLAFLDLLRDLDIYSMVMLTLTRDNLDQVIPLAEILEGRADLFTFNRLALVGRGKDLLLPEKSAYLSFLHDYLDASRRLAVVARKDNLLNAVLHDQGQPLFGGCTGHGCGAAFNFVSLLPDGAVHACRKFPSPIGQVFAQSLEEIYDSAAARQYRAGPGECRGCSLRPVCGGCLAVAHSLGLNIFEQKDPFCPGRPSEG